MARLTNKEKELIAVGTAVSAGCRRCSDYHFKKVFEEGASLQEVQKAVADATDAIRNAEEAMQQKAHALMNIERAQQGQHDVAGSDRMALLVKIGAAVASNCTTTIEEYIRAAKAAGIAPEEISVSVKLGQMILTRAGEFAAEAIAELLA